MAGLSLAERLEALRAAPMEDLDELDEPYVPPHNPFIGQHKPFPVRSFLLLCLQVEPFPQAANRHEQYALLAKWLRPFEKLPLPTGRYSPLVVDTTLQHIGYLTDNNAQAVAKVLFDILNIDATKLRIF